MSSVKVVVGTRKRFCYCFLEVSIVGRLFLVDGRHPNPEEL
ncbi:MAG: hypothetical protein WAN51_10970 [Alphaproteobacteria bacterium]